MAKRSAASNGTSSPITLFASARGIYAIGSPVKVKILAMLRQKEMPFDGIVAASGKVKSTISVHLDDLVERGIVVSRPDPDDARKKIFFVNAEFIGEASDERRLHDDTVPDRFSDITLDSEPTEFYRFTFRTIRVTLMQQGISIDPLLCSAGVVVGRSLYPALAAPDLGLFLYSIIAFWEHHRLGRIEVESRCPIALRIYDCFECVDLPETGRPACAFESGILTALFSLFSGGDPSVTETQCYAMGSGHCRFVIVLPEKK
jgi:predicted hydrocarbon binding protein